MNSFTKFLLKRSIYTVFIIFIIITLIFALFEAMPLKPYDRLRTNPQLKPEQLNATITLYGYDQPVQVRYTLFVKNTLTLDLGLSHSYLQPVRDVIMQKLPRTLLLVGGSTILAYGLGILIGAVMAWRRGGPGDISTVVVSLLFYNMPSFWLGLIFIYAFSFKFEFFPLGGFQDPTSAIYIKYGATMDLLWHAALPIIVLTLLSLAGTILLMRTSMLDVMNEPYMLTAQAKGLRPWKVLYKHGVRNAMLPVMTSFILSMALSVSGAIITEQVFSYQGLGQLFISSLYSLDYPVAMGCTYIFALVIVLANFLADAIYGVLDPRVRVG